MDVTKISLCFLSGKGFTFKSILALYLPYCSISSSESPSFSAISVIGSSVAWSAISISVMNISFLSLGLS